MDEPLTRLSQCSEYKHDFSAFKLFISHFHPCCHCPSCPLVLIAVVLSSNKYNTIGKFPVSTKCSHDSYIWCEYILYIWCIDIYCNALVHTKQTKGFGPVCAQGQALLMSAWHTHTEGWHMWHSAYGPLTDGTNEAVLLDTGQMTASGTSTKWVEVCGESGRCPLKEMVLM